MVSFNSLWREKFTLLDFWSSKSEFCFTKEVFCLVFWPLETFKWFKGFSILDGEHFKVRFVVRRSALCVAHILSVVSLLFLLICLSLASVLFLVFLFFSVSLVFSFFFMFCWHGQHYGWVESFCCSKVLWQKLGTVVDLWPPPAAGSWWRQWQYYWSLPYMLLSKFTYWTCGWKIGVTVVIVQPDPQVFLCF